MVFSSLEFLLRFLPLVLLLYFAAPVRFRNMVLVAASLLFYAWGEPVYLALIIASCAVNYALGLRIDRHLNTRRARFAMCLSILINLTLLGFFKYTDFLINTINSLSGANIGLLHLPLPLGISFYTFQALSYILDVYKGRTPAQKNPADFIFYMMFFPQLIAGPIVRYPLFADDLTHRTHSSTQFASGVHRFVLGLGKKVIIGNSIGQLWDIAVKTSNPSVLMSWLGITAYALQIYYDFSGYSDMAIGLGSMFGFNLPENFNFPYFSQSITEFWRRWHITLGQWFRDYLYIPLGGNRVSAAKWIRNIFLVWFLTGLWHGASWNFCLWGLYFGVVLMVEKIILTRLLVKLPKLLRHGYALLLIVVGWTIFGLGSVHDILAYLGNMFALNKIALTNFESVYMLRSNFVLLLIACAGAVPLVNAIYHKYSEKKFFGALVMPVLTISVLIVSLAYIIDSSFNPFLYFRF